MSLHSVIPQDMYARYLKETAEFNRDFVKTLPGYEQEALRKFKETAGDEKQERQREGLAFKLIKARAAAIHGENGEKYFTKAGVTSSLGYNFYDLRAPVQLSYPVNVPFRNDLPRIGKVNAGVGTAAHWKATRDPGVPYAGAREGERVQIGSPDENDYTATYKEIGTERGVTFTAEFSGEGFADNVADEHLRGLHSLWLQEEGLMLLGNSGTASGNNGFTLGVTPTPVCTKTATTSNTTLGGSASVTVFCVALTGMGNPANAQYGYGVFPSVAAGLTPSYPRTNQDNTVDTINGGMGTISLVSNTASTDSGHQAVTAVVTPVKGAFGYAWYVSINASPTTANSYLYAVTAFPSVLINTVPDATKQPATHTGLNADHSWNTLDFDGLVTYAASTPGAYWNDLAGASLTSNKDGSVSEIEAVLEDRWTNFQAGIDGIWCGSAARLSIDQAIRYAGTGSTGFQFVYTRDSQGNLMGGYLVSGYKSKWSMDRTGGIEIPIRTHPMLPPNAIYFDVKNNPYPHSRARFVRGMLVQREYYSIEWPLVTRQWTFGTYVHEVLAHNYPWLTAVLAGVGPFVGN
jgi:hypothetical protein